MLAFDTETALIQPGLLAPPLTCVSVYNGHHGELHPHWHLGVFEGTLSTDVVGHNIAFDMGVLGTEHPSLLPRIFKAYRENRVYDTQIRETLTHIAAGVFKGYEGSSGWVQLEYSLAACAKRHLGVVMDKDTWRLRYGELRGVPIADWEEGARTYPLLDAECTYKIWEKQRVNEEYLEDQHAQTRAAWFLHLSSMWGLRTDPARVEALAEMVGEDHERLKALLIEKGFVREDGSRCVKKVQQVMESVWPDGPRTNPSKTFPNGQAKLDDQTCRDSHDPDLINYAEYSAVMDMKSKDLPILKCGIVQTRYNPLQITGRVSSSNPNIQNLKRRPGVRECFVARPGTVFVIADFKGFELHTWAQACLDYFGQSEMAKALNSGRDPHSEIANNLPGDVEFKEKRQVGKALNFGKPGGLGDRTFMVYALSNYGVRLNIEESRDAGVVWRNQWPEYEPWFELAGRLNKEPRFQHKRSKRWRGGGRFTQVANELFQGFASDIAKDAGWHLTLACYEEEGWLLGSRIVGFIHDEFIVEVPEQFGHECGHEVARVMKTVADRWTPDVPNEVEWSLSRCWSKLAKRVEVDGRVVPWDISMLK